MPTQVSETRAEGPAGTSVEAKPLCPFLDLTAQFHSIQNEIMQAVARVMESQRFILGLEVQALEDEVAGYVGTKAAIGCASGSDALLLALMALGVGPGDEVVTTPFTFVATVGSIVRLQAKPVFVDIDPDTLNIDPSLLQAALTSRTRAIMPVHLFGLMADMDPILEIGKTHGVPVIEDAAQAIGSKYRDHRAGSLGAIGCFSFFPSKNLGGAGDGGMVTTNDPVLADRLRVLRNHGSRTRYSYELIGMNSRLDALQAAILRVKLPLLDVWAEGRRLNAERYWKLFKALGLDEHVALPSSPEGFHHVYNQFTIRAPKRDELRDFLRHRGIPTEVYYPSPLHFQPAFEYLGHEAGQFPQAETASREVVSLPIYPELREQHQIAIVEAIARFYGRARQ